MVAVRFTRGETNFPRVDLDASRSGSLPATLVLATSEPVRCNGCQCTGYPCLLIVFTQIYLQVIFTILAVNQPIVTRESSSYYSYLFRYNYVTMFRIRVTQQIVEFSLSHREC